MLRVRLRKEVCAFNKQSSNFVAHGIACRVEHTQFRSKRNGLARKIIPAKNRCFEIDIGKKYVDMLRRTQDCKRLVYVAGRKCLMTPILNHQLRNLADKHIVFDDKYHGH